MPSSHLLTDPLCSPADIGKSIPDIDHAVSVCLPTWESVVEYSHEDGTSEKYDGGSRLHFHPLVQKLFRECEDRFAQEGERAIAFPSEEVALRAQEYLQSETECTSSVHELEREGIFVLCFPQEHIAVVQKYWRYSGEIISSRLADHVLGQEPLAPDVVRAAKSAKVTLRKRIAEMIDENYQNIVLFPTGMSALSTVHRFLQISFPERKSVQFGFSYADGLHVQQEFGNGVHFFPNGDARDLEQLEELLKKEKILGIFCELPVSPTKKTINIDRLKMLSKKYTVPIIVDDTMGCFQNRQEFAFADIAVSSLTKFFSGVGNVSGGAIILHPESRFFHVFTRVFRANFEDLCFAPDILELEKNSRDFAQRMDIVRRNTEKMYEYLSQHEEVYKVFLPKFSDGGDSDPLYGVFSFLLYQAETHAPKFYDALEVCKGPNFGMNFTMACPYIQLHKSDKMTVAQKNGLSPHLIRISVGVEDIDDLIGRFEKAFGVLS